MKKLVMLIISSLLAVSFSAVVATADSSPVGGSIGLAGKVVTIQDDKLVVSVTKKGEQTVAIDAATVYTMGMEQGKATKADLAVGDSVMVDATPSSPKGLVAKSVMIHKAKRPAVQQDVQPGHEGHGH